MSASVKKACPLIVDMNAHDPVPTGGLGAEFLSRLQKLLLRQERRHNRKKISFMLSPVIPSSGDNAGSSEAVVIKNQKVVEVTREGLTPSLAEVIHLIRYCCDSAPVFITTATRLFSGPESCCEDIQKLLHAMECRFGVRFPPDEEALSKLFRLERHDYLCAPPQSLLLSTPSSWRLSDTFCPAYSDLSVGDFYRVFTMLFVNDGDM